METTRNLLMFLFLIFLWFCNEAQGMDFNKDKWTNPIKKHDKLKIMFYLNGHDVLQLARTCKAFKELLNKLLTKNVFNNLKMSENNILRDQSLEYLTNIDYVVSLLEDAYVLQPKDPWDVYKSFYLFMKYKDIQVLRQHQETMKWKYLKNPNYLNPMSGRTIDDDFLDRHTCNCIGGYNGHENCRRIREVFGGQGIKVRMAGKDLALSEDGNIFKLRPPEFLDNRGRMKEIKNVKAILVRDDIWVTDPTLVLTQDGKVEALFEKHIIPDEIQRELVDVNMLFGTVFNNIVLKKNGEIFCWVVEDDDNRDHKESNFGKVKDFLKNVILFVHTKHYCAALNENNQIVIWREPIRTPGRNAPGNSIGLYEHDQPYYGKDVLHYEESRKVIKLMVSNIKEIRPDLLDAGILEAIPKDKFSGILAKEIKKIKPNNDRENICFSFGCNNQ